MIDGGGEGDLQGPRGSDKVDGGGGWCMSKKRGRRVRD